MPAEKYYRILNLEPSASRDEIRKAYRKMVMLYHPDRNPEPGAEEKFLLIKEAYDILMGKKVEHLRTTRSTSKTSSASKKEEYEQRVKEAQKRYEEQQKKEFIENELYFRKLTSGRRWKIMRIMALTGTLMAALLIADQFLPRHYDTDRVAAYSFNRANSEDGQSISLIETESGSRYWISRFKYSLVSVNTSIYIERSWIFHNPIRIVSIEKLGYSVFPIHFRFYRHSWLLIILFLLPIFTLWYKRRTISFTVLYNFVYYGIGGLMLFYLLTGDRWAHVLTLGFF